MRFATDDIQLELRIEARRGARVGMNEYRFIACTYARAMGFLVTAESLWYPSVKKLFDHVRRGWIPTLESSIQERALYQLARLEVPETPQPRTRPLARRVKKGPK